MSTPTAPARTQLQRRRGMTSPADMTRSSLTLPDPSTSKPSTAHRPPSPLRNAFVPSTSTGIDPDGSFGDASEDDEDDINDDQHKRNKNYPYQSSSPASSVSQLAASFAQRVGSFVSNNLPAGSLSRSSSIHHLPSDAELEAEAKKERERSRREAERILTREAEERRMADERILAMKERGEPLPPPPSRAQTMSSSNPSSPSGSPKSKENSNWWAAAKNRLTPTKEKEPLTPAQQVILEAKAREKEKSQGWLSDPAMLNLNIPFGPPTRPVPTSPVSPTPSRNQAPNLTPSPMRSNSDAVPSPSREAHPIYAQFTSQGTLDVHGTLLTIVKRFEKLEKWTVGHVRALEERMSDVERWLVEKEKEKEKEEKSPKDNTSTRADDSDKPPCIPQNVSQELSEVKEGLSELQGRVGELGREMARMGTQRPTSPPLSIPSSLPGSAFTTPHHSRLSSGTARDSTSPPLASTKPTGTRLPYPAGDYASPPNNLFSPPHSPPASLNSTTRSRPIAIPSSEPNTNTTTNTTTSASLGIGLPSSTSLSTSYSSTSFTSVSSISSRPLPSSPKSHSASSSIARVASPPLTSMSTSSLSLPPPKIPASTSPSGSPSGKRQTSVSPTPRKRYTVALGDPIVPREPQAQDSPPATPSTKRTHSRNQSIMSVSSIRDGSECDKAAAAADDDDDESDGQFGGETIGKKASSRILAGSAAAGANGYSDGNSNADFSIASINTTTTTTATPNSNDKHPNDRPPSPSILSRRRARPQTVYDFSSYLNQHQQQQMLQSRSSQQSLQSVHSAHSLSSQKSAGSSGAGSVAPLAVRSRWRSQSTDRGDGGNGAATSGRFVDPLMLRKQERETATKLPMPKPMGKIPVGELVAFFDGDKKDKS